MSPPLFFSKFTRKRGTGGSNSPVLIVAYLAPLKFIEVGVLSLCAFTSKPFELPAGFSARSFLYTKTKGYCPFCK